MMMVLICPINIKMMTMNTKIIILMTRVNWEVDHIPRQHQDDHIDDQTGLTGRLIIFFIMINMIILMTRVDREGEVEVCSERDTHHPVAALAW